MGTYLKKWAYAAGVRALRTAAQTALAMVPFGFAIHEIGWVTVASVSATAAVLSLLTSLATKLPEVEGDQ